jgi:hypothetical protein
MIYNNFDELIAGMWQWMEWRNEIGEPVSPDESSVEEFMRLINTYFYAKDNPPEGSIGVGAITYAEHKLREAQQ